MTAPSAPVRRPFSDGWTLALRLLQMYKNTPALIAISLGAPLLMLLVFGYVFGSAIDVPDYRNYLMPGLFVTTSVNGIMGAMVGAARDRRSGITDRLGTMPISRGAVMLGSSLADLLVNAVIFAGMAGVGLLVGWRATDGVPRAIAAFGLLLLLRFALTRAGFVLGRLCKREDIAAQLGTLVFPVAMVSNVFVPTTGMPGWLRAIADWNPVSAATAACRTLFGSVTPGGAWPLTHPVVATLGWCAVLLVLFVPLSRRVS
ncbi:MAG: ABC transporter permease [Streptosporangiaceae bacterium]